MTLAARRWFVTFWLCLAGGLAHSHGSWPLGELAAQEAERAEANADGRPTPLISGAYLRVAWGAAERMLRAMPLSPVPEFIVIPDLLPNAFAFVDNRQPRIAVSFGMLRLLGNDADAWAALWGHEMAHLKENHSRMRSERKNASRTSSELWGLLLSIAGVPLGDLVVDGATELAERSYSRDDERVADRLGVLAMARAGFDPQGAVRFQEALAKAGSGRVLQILSTHPGSAERVETMRELARELSAPDDTEKR